MQAAEPTTLVLIVAVAGTAMGLAGKALELGVAAVRRHNGQNPDSRPGGFRSEDALLLRQTHGAAIGTEGKLREVMPALLDQQRQQVEATKELTQEMRSFREELKNRRGL